jgi:hypothetical protein
MGPLLSSRTAEAGILLQFQTAVVFRGDVTIYSETNGVLNMQPFLGPTLYDSEVEADIHGIAYGQRIIDEKVPGLKADSLLK